MPWTNNRSKRAWWTSFKYKLGTILSKSDPIPVMGYLIKALKNSYQIISRPLANLFPKTIRLSTKPLFHRSTYTMGIKRLAPIIREIV